LALNLLEYQTAILRRDFATAESLLPSLPNDQRNRVARFLESLDLKELALSVTTDPEHRFDLAIQLRKVNLAHQLAQQADNEQKWRQVAEYAFAEWNLPLAEECLKRAKDLPGLLMIYTAIGDQQGLIALAEQAGKSGKRNIEFTCHYLC
jgi:coatomer subunit beta'